MKKRVNWTTMFMSLAEEMQEFLTNMGITFKISGGGFGVSTVWQFDIRATDDELDAIGVWLKERTICERTV